jgi:hypothetical protein
MRVHSRIVAIRATTNRNNTDKNSTTTFGANNLTETIEDTHETLVTIETTLDED